MTWLHSLLLRVRGRGQGCSVCQIPLLQHGTHLLIKVLSQLRVGLYEIGSRPSALRELGVPAGVPAVVV